MASIVQERLPANRHERPTTATTTTATAATTTTTTIVIITAIITVAITTSIVTTLVITAATRAARASRRGQPARRSRHSVAAMADEESGAAREFITCRARGEGVGGKGSRIGNHTKEIPLENATENPLELSSKIHLGSDNPLENAAERYLLSLEGHSHLALHPQRPPRTERPSATQQERARYSKCH